MAYAGGAIILEAGSWAKLIVAWPGGAVTIQKGAVVPEVIDYGGRIVDERPLKQE